MEKLFFLLSLSLLLSFSHLVHGGSEEWGYVPVRPKAHMFWWHYKSPYRVEDPSKPWPIILWLQGGPGASGVGLGNFEEIGPLDAFLKPRNSTWLKMADLLFVDNPVGTGYSFVEEDDLFVKSDVEAAADLTTLLEQLFNGNEMLQKSPLYIVAESYGGKFAVTLGLSALSAIEAGRLKLKLGGVALGNSWISPEDFTSSWGPLLKDLSRLDDNGLEKSNSVAEKVKKEISEGRYVDAVNSWTELEGVISEESNNVDFYNFLVDSGMDGLSAMKLSDEKTRRRRYASYLSSKPGGKADLDSLMNGVIKKKLGIIPPNVTWGGQSDSVFSFLEGDFMRPRINEVDELLGKGVNVTVYNGQVDLICATKGVDAWVHKLKWEGLQSFVRTERKAVYCGGEEGGTKAFAKSYKNLHFYWILGAGHYIWEGTLTVPAMGPVDCKSVQVPVDQPCVALEMVGAITQSPASVSSTI